MDGVEPSYQSDSMRQITLSQKIALAKLGHGVSTAFHSLVRDMVDAENFSEVPIPPSSVIEIGGVTLVYQLGPTFLLEVQPRMRDDARLLSWAQAHRFHLLRITNENRVVA